MSGMTWKEFRLHYMEFMYGRYVAEYEESRNDDGLWRDDRGIFVNTYHMIIRAIQSLSEEPDNFIACAMNEAIKKECEALDKIASVFEIAA